MSRQAATHRGRPFPRPNPSPGPDLQQRQQQAVEAAALQQAELRAGAAQLAEQHEQSHLVRGDPVADSEHVRVHDAVGQHRVEVQALMHARHGGAGARPSPRKPRAPPPRRPIAALAAGARAAPQPIGGGDVRRHSGAAATGRARERCSEERGVRAVEGLPPRAALHGSQAAAADSEGVGCAWAAAALRSYLLDKGTDVFSVCWPC